MSSEIKTVEGPSILTNATVRFDGFCQTFASLAGIEVTNRSGRAACLTIEGSCEFTTQVVEAGHTVKRQWPEPYDKCVTG